MSVVVRVLALAYKSLCRVLEYLEEGRYIIVVDPQWDYFWDRFSGQVGNTAICLRKRYHKMRFVTYIFTKLAQNVCPINTHILIYQHTRCNWKLWKAQWLYSFFLVFSYIIDDYSCLKNCIFIKISLIMCVIIVDILICQHARCDCKS